MKIPIAYALTYPERLKLTLPRLDLTAAPNLEFYHPDLDKFPALKLAYQVCATGGTMPAAFNAANEVAVAAFLDNRISFPAIARIVAETVALLPHGQATDLAAILTADHAARTQAGSLIDSLQQRPPARGK
jgi:1-deoxy-D-xylulose-5-phosphate reductoisomerase